MPFRVITVVDEGFIRGGGEKCALLGAIYMARRGHPVDILCAFGPVSAFVSDEPNVTTHYLDVPNIDQETSKWRGMRRQMWNTDARRKMAEILAGCDPADTVVHAHCWMRALSSAPLDVAIDKGFRVVITLNDYGIACPSRVFYNHRTETICTLKPLSSACVCTECTNQGYVRKSAMLARGYVQQWFARLGSRASGFVAVGPFSKEIFMPFIRHDVPIETIHNPNDLPETSMCQAAENSAYVYVGRLIREKAPAFVAKAARLAGIPVVFVGDGPEREAVLAENPDAKITGWVDKSEVVRQIRSARALILASRWYECAPMVIQDAMSQGIPVLTSHYCAGVEVVEDGKNGFVFRGDDVEDLVAKLNLLSDDRLVTDLGKGAYDSFQSGGYVESEHADQLDRFYREVLARPVTVGKVGR